MILIRLIKQNSNNNLSYSLVVCNKKNSSKSGNFLEKIGFYRPITDKWSNKYVYVNKDRLSFWLRRGAKISSSVYLLVRPILINK